MRADETLKLCSAAPSIESVKNVNRILVTRLFTIDIIYIYIFIAGTLGYCYSSQAFVCLFQKIL